jgi:hypothetical protein
VLEDLDHPEVRALKGREQRFYERGLARAPLSPQQHVIGADSGEEILRILVDLLFDRVDPDQVVVVDTRGPLDGLEALLLTVPAVRLVPGEVRLAGRGAST